MGIWRILKSTWCSWIIRLIMFGIGCLLFVGISYGESFFYPVVDAVRITQISRSERTLAATGVLHKARSCTFIGIQAVGYYKGKRVADLDVSKPTREMTRPVGSYEFGPLLVQLPREIPDVDLVKIDALHDCHPIWATRSHIADIPIRPY